MTEVIRTNWGGCLGLRFAWRDENGPIDITGREFLVLDAYPKALMDASFSIVDAESGITRLFFNEALKSRMGKGRVNWVRIGMGFPGSCTNTSRQIWIEVN